MKALTLWQPWASLIIVGAKPIEWRHWRAPASMVGQHIVIHASARPMRQDEVYALWRRCLAESCARARGEKATEPTSMFPDLSSTFLLDVLDERVTLPLAAGLGTAVLGTPALASDLGFAPGTVGLDSDRLEKQNWGWPLTDVKRWDEPIPMRGRQSFWNWPTPEELGL